MAEILTESFCERCGTRYTFETPQPRGRSLAALGTFGRGLKHFVVMPDASLDEAMAVARSEAESKVTTAQLEAFHRTFNFCLSCRQYTCSECWNAVEGRCLTCAPMPEAEAAPATEAAVASVSDDATDDAVPVTWSAVELAGATVLEAPAQVEPVEAVAPAEVEPEPVAAEPEPEPEPVEAIAVAPAVEPEAEPVAAPEPVPSVAAPEPAQPSAPEVAGSAAGGTVVSAFPGFMPGRSLDEEIAAYELRIAALAAMPPEPLTRPAPLPAQAPPAAAASAPVMPAAPTQRPTQRPARAAAPAASATTPTAGVAAAAGVAAPGTCATCGLSLSASARFCRRCGTRQGA